MVAALVAVVLGHLVVAVLVVVVLGHLVVVVLGRLVVVVLSHLVDLVVVVLDRRCRPEACRVLARDPRVRHSRSSRLCRSSTTWR